MNYDFLCWHFMEMQQPEQSGIFSKDVENYGNYVYIYD